jgi:hypothetical protein
MFEHLEKSDDVKCFLWMCRVKFFWTHGKDFAKAVIFACETDRILIEFDPRNFKPGMASSRKEISHTQLTSNSRPFLGAFRVRQEKSMSWFAKNAGHTWDILIAMRSDRSQEHHQGRMPGSRGIE